MFHDIQSKGIICVILISFFNLKEATIIRECLHRFCSECIHNLLRFGSKTSQKVVCPSCRTPIPSRRSLRRDTKFDQLIEKVVGNPSEHEQNVQLGEDDYKKMGRLQHAAREKRRIVRQQQRHQMQGRKQQTSSEFNAIEDHARLRLENLEESPLLELELRKHPHEVEVDHLERAFLTIRGDAKISLLKSFLTKKLEDRMYEISSKLDDESVVLDDELSLIEAKETLCPERSELLVLKYRTVATID